MEHHSDMSNQAKLKELQAARAAKEAKLHAEATVAAETQAIADAEALLAMDGRQGFDFDVISTVMGVIILRRADGPVYRKFQDVGRFDMDSQEKLMFQCLVYPSTDRVAAIVSKLPLVLTRAGNVITSLAGAKEAEQAEKS